MIAYQVLKLELTAEHKKNSTVEMYEYEDGSTGVREDFWGAFLPNGRMFACDGKIRFEEAQSAYLELCRTIN